MYNGIGLQTPRGSGTNGYTQTNKFFVKPRPGGGAYAAASGIPRGPHKDGDGAGPAIRKANREILDHDRKRRIQLRLIVLEETLVDQGYTASEIAERLAEAKEAYEAEATASASDGAGRGGGVGDVKDSTTTTDNKRFSDAHTHQVALRKEQQSEMFRAALKITRDQPSEPELQEQKFEEKISDSGSEDSGYEERKEHEGVLKNGHKELGRDVTGLAGQDREKSQKKAPAEEPTTKDMQRTQNEAGGKMDDAEKSKHNRSKDGRSRVYSDPDSDSSRRKGGKTRKGHRKSSQSDTSEDDSEILSRKKTKYVSNQKKSKRKDYSSSSDAEGTSGKNANRETQKHAKQHRRHDSDSDSEEAGKYKKRQKYDSDSRGNTRENSQARKDKRQRHDSDSDSERNTAGGNQGKYKKRQRHDSKDSGSDIEKKSNELLKIKQMGKKKSSRRRDSENSESDTDIEKGSRNSKGKTKQKFQKSKGQIHDSEDSHSDAIVEKKRKGNLVEKRTKHRAINETEHSDSDVCANRKDSRSRVAKHGKSESPTEDSGSDSFDSDSSTGSDSSTDYSQVESGGSPRREDAVRKADINVVKVQQRPDLEEHVSSFRSSRRNALDRDDHDNNNNRRMNEKLEASRRTERNEKFVSKRDLNDDDRVCQETRRKRMRDEDELDELPNLKRNVGYEVSEDRKQKESRGEDSAGHRDYSRSREDRKKVEYYSSNKLEEKWELKVRPKEETGSRKSDRDFRGDDAFKVRRLGDLPRHRREDIPEDNHADGDRYKPDASRHRREERYEHIRGVNPDFDHHNSDHFRRQREERYKSNHNGDPSRDQYKYHHSRREREERHDRRHDDSGHYDRHRGR